jgi:hypothetical protein
VAAAERAVIIGNPQLFPSTRSGVFYIVSGMKLVLPIAILLYLLYSGVLTPDANGYVPYQEELVGQSLNPSVSILPSRYELVPKGLNND